jgi:hypothetical protein
MIEWVAGTDCTASSSIVLTARQAATAAAAAAAEGGVASVRALCYRHVKDAYVAYACVFTHLHWKHLQLWYAAAAAFFSLKSKPAHHPKNQRNNSTAI